MSADDKPESLEAFVDQTKSGAPGDHNYRAFVGPPQQYDFMGATQFRLATSLGLREIHHYLDVGCGSLRAGKFLIQYLLPGRYHGIEPNEWLIKDAVDREIGQDLLRIKAPKFSRNEDLDLTCFDQRFDFIVAQSIFSHTGYDLLTSAFGRVRDAANDGCQFLFTAVTEDDPGAAEMAEGFASSGWIYPECVRFTVSDVEGLCRLHGLFVQKLDWFHPRQTWFRVVSDAAHLLSTEQVQALGTGEVVNDLRALDA